MKKIMTYLLVLVSLSFSCFAGMDETTPYLCIDDRPAELKSKIDGAFKAIDRDSERNWAYNGESSYNMMGYNSLKLITALIRKVPQDQKIYTVLDIGAGNFQFGRALAQHLNKIDDLPEWLQIRIVSIRAEKAPKFSEPNIVGRCKIYEIGNFKIEDIVNEFKRHDLDLTNSVDYIETRWCLRHLADPAGTFVEAYKLLRPYTGLFIGDGFYFNIEGLDKENFSNENMYRLLLSTKQPFLIHQYDEGRSLNRFMIKKSNADALKLPFIYADKMQSVEKVGNQVWSGVITHFSTTAPKISFHYEEFYDEFDALRKEGVFFLGNNQDFFNELTGLPVKITNWQGVIKKVSFFLIDKLVRVDAS